MISLIIFYISAKYDKSTEDTFPLVFYLDFMIIFCLAEYFGIL